MVSMEKLFVPLEIRIPLIRIDVDVPYLLG